jgi:hypothetical protein
MGFAEGVGALLGGGDCSAIMIENGHGAQIIFEGTWKISFRFLNLPADEESLAVSEGIGWLHDFFLECG